MFRPKVIPSNEEGEARVPWQIVMHVKGVSSPVVRTYVDGSSAAVDFEVIRASHQRQRWVDGLDWLTIDGQNIVSAHLEEIPGVLPFGQAPLA